MTQLGRAVDGGGQAGGQLDLDRIGVLELVDEQAPVAAAQGLELGEATRAMKDGHQPNCEEPLRRGAETWQPRKRGDLRDV